MKTEEDEAFDEIARKQGHWGGGFMAKRAMAADKQRPWVGLTEEDFSAINQSCFTKLQAATSAESILKERNI
jgi:hypothetical protein